MKEKITGLSEKQVQNRILKGQVNKEVIGQYDEGIYMMKYNEIKIVK